MKTVAFIPVRGGSKSIPLKNIKSINGKPLVYWTIKAAAECKYIDTIYVATDSDIIRKTVDSFSFENVSVIPRSPETASDTASTESAMLEFAENYHFDTIVLIQATSPLLTVSDLDGGFEKFNEPSVDSVLSVVRQKRFIWDFEGNAVNYNPLKRPRRQEFDGYLVENGAFYITSQTRLVDTRCRISGNIKTYEMSEESYFEIDEPSDWVIIEQLMKRNSSVSPSKKNLSGIKMLLTDCDGCLTDGGMYYSESGEMLKKFNTKDGMGLSLLMKSGLIVGIVTGEVSESVRKRADKLHISEYHAGVQDKFSLAVRLCDKYGITLDEVAYVGDDLNDLPLIKAVGFGCATANAVSAVKDAADYITQLSGGSGAVREVADLLLSKRLQ